MLDSIAANGEYAVESVHIGNNPEEIDKRFSELNIQHLAKTIEPEMSTLQALGFQGLPATLVIIDNKIAYRYTGYIKQKPEVVQSWLSCLAKTQQPSELELGKALYINPGKGGCATCHGLDGNQPAMPFYPKIGGQTELYLVNQMKDYKNKQRKNGLYIPMEVAMQPYTNEEISLIAKYLAAINN